MTAFVDGIVAWRRAVILVSFFLAAICGYGLTFLGVDPDSRVFFGKDNPHRVALDELENKYSQVNNVVIILVPKDGRIFTPRMLAIIEDIADRAELTPYSFRVDSLANYPHSYARGDDIIVERLYRDAGALTPPDADRIKNVAMSSDSLVDKVVSAKADVTAITILVTKPREGIGAVQEIATFVHELAAEAERDYPEIEVRLTGGVMADMAFAEAGERDLSLLIPLMLGIIVVTLWLGLRSWAGTVATVLVIVFSVVIPFGIAGYAGLVLNAATTGAPIMIMTLCIADCVHLLTTLSQRRRAGREPTAAVIEAIRINLAPIAVTSLTTAIGFAALVLSDVPPLRMLGLLVAGGMIAGFVLSLTLLPALVLTLRRPGELALVGGSTAMRSLANFTIRRRRPLLLLFVIATPLLIAGLPRNQLDDNFVNYFDEGFAFRRDTDFLQQRLTGLNTLLYSVPAGEDQGVTRPDYLSRLDAFAEWFRGQAGVIHAATLADPMKRLNKNMHGDDPAYERVPDRRDLAAQYLLFYEMSLPGGTDLSDSIDVARSSSLAVIRLRHVTSADIKRLAVAGEEWLRTNAPDMAAPATGLSVLYAYLTERNTRAMVIGTTAALILISLSLLVILRSLRIGLISFAPNLIPAAITFGIWGYVSGEVNLAVSVVGAMTLGVVVDDTVHFLSKYLWARRYQGLDPADAIRETFAMVGPALILTSTALVLGFGVLSLSGFAVSSLMGILSAITIAVALVADLLFLPPLIQTFGERRS